MPRVVLREPLKELEPVVLVETKTPETEALPIASKVEEMEALVAANLKRPVMFLELPVISPPKV
jgi:hypothetical protein